MNNRQLEFDEPAGRVRRNATGSSEAHAPVQSGVHLMTLGVFTRLLWGALIVAAIFGAFFWATS